VSQRLHSPASALSGGEQKQLEIGRALLLRPKVILIDEPSIGLSPMVVADVFKLLRKLADQGTTVLMVERNVKSALKISDEAIALESGRLVLQKPASELLADPHIERLFLGGAHTGAATSPRHRLNPFVFLFDDREIPWPTPTPQRRRPRTH